MDKANSGWLKHNFCLFLPPCLLAKRFFPLKPDPFFSPFVAAATPRDPRAVVRIARRQLRWAAGQGLAGPQKSGFSGGFCTGDAGDVMLKKWDMSAIGTIREYVKK